ncbi:MAG: Fe-Mn family superoxide dismutase [Candidatus Dasytiphilus stammeri]
MQYFLPKLPYDYDALEPYIDKYTMEIHYTKHHQSYINNANAVLEDLPEYAKLPIEKLIMQLQDIPNKNQQTILRNNAGGHLNHSIFWKGLQKNTVIQGALKNAIELNFGSFKQFKEIFEKSAMNCFGSGWIWLVLQLNNQLSIVSTANQDNPLMGINLTGIYGYPIIGLDIWEHAYYLKYQNRRLDYVHAFWNIVNWNEAELRYLNHNK